MAATTSLLAALDLSPLVVERVTFGEGEAAFDVDIQHVDKSTLEVIGTASVKTVMKKGVSTKEADIKSFRTALRDQCLRGWEGLTYGKVLRACNRTLPADGKLKLSETETKSVDDPVPFSVGDAMVLLEYARGVIEGEVRNFDDWLYTEATRIADVKAAQEAIAKND